MTSIGSDDLIHKLHSMAIVNSILSKSESKSESPTTVTLNRVDAAPLFGRPNHQYVTS